METESFGLDSNVIPDWQRLLLRAFLERIRSSYSIENDLSDVRFRKISIGFAPVEKLFTSSEHIYPYFIKLGKADEIQKESMKYGKAAQCIPPLNIPPRDVLLKGSKFDEAFVKDYSLIAFRYITGRRKNAAPKSLYSAYGSVDRYELLRIIDDIFQIVLRDLHSFSKASIKPVEYLILNTNNFENNGFPSIKDLVSRYNSIITHQDTTSFPCGTIHGDIHFDNILLGWGNQPVLIDFAMLREDSCLAADFAEFEVAMLVAALLNDFEEASIDALGFYSFSAQQKSYGVGRFSRSAQAVRTNLLELCSENTQWNKDIQNMDHIYDIYILRYICSYLNIVVKTMKAEKKHAIVSFLTQIFGIVEARRAGR